MSFVRWGEDSSVYVYESFSGFECCMCATLPNQKEMVAHLKDHLERGDKVPSYAIERLESEIDGPRP